MNQTIIDRLLKSEEPSIRFKMRMNVFNENPHSPSMIALQQEIKLSNRVQRLLSGRTEDGKLNPISNPYQKWHGAHWVGVQSAPDGAIHSSIGKATEVFLTRHMFRRKRDGQVINAEFLKLHYPRYWHYDILFGLKVMSECGFIKDPRCEEALNILESKELPDGGGGWPAEGRCYQISTAEDAKPKPNSDKVSWGTNSKKCMNEWVTADALFVLSRAGRISV